MVRQAVILCGGEGTRLGDALRFAPAYEVPKVLQEVGGKPFVTYAINYLKGIGFTNIFLMVKFKAEDFYFLESIDGIVKLVQSSDDVNQSILSIPILEDLFLLLNGDCFPVMDWREFCNTDQPRTAIKIVDRDAGAAIVRKSDVESNRINCSDIRPMDRIYEKYTILGGLHIGTYQGLERARQFMDLVVFGQ